MKMEGMAYMAVLRSPVAHGRILSVDAAAAKAAASVIDVLTAADIAEAVDPMPVTTREGAVLVPVPVPLLARDKVRSRSRSPAPSTGSRFRTAARETTRPGTTAPSPH